MELDACKAMATACGLLAQIPHPANPKGKVPIKLSYSADLPTYMPPNAQDDFMIRS